MQGSLHQRERHVWAADPMSLGPLPACMQLSSTTDTSAMSYDLSHLSGSTAAPHSACTATAHTQLVFAESIHKSNAFATGLATLKSLQQCGKALYQTGTSAPRLSMILTKKDDSVFARSSGASSWLRCPTPGSMMHVLRGSLLLTTAAALRGTTLWQSMIMTYQGRTSAGGIWQQDRVSAAPVIRARDNQGWQALDSLEALLHPPAPHLPRSRDLWTDPAQTSMPCRRAAGPMGATATWYNAPR